MFLHGRVSRGSVSNRYTRTQRRFNKSASKLTIFSFAILFAYCDFVRDSYMRTYVVLHCLIYMRTYFVVHCLIYMRSYFVLYII